MPEIPKFMIDAWEKRGSGGSISLEELQELLCAITANISTIAYIIIDALDECVETFPGVYG